MTFNLALIKSMKNPKEIYQERITDFSFTKKKIQQKLLVFSLLRLLVFVLGITAIFQFWGNVKWIALSVFVSMGVFVVLIRLFANSKYQKNKLEALIEINQLELDTTQSNFQHHPNGEKFANDQHSFSQDIDLFGEKSFFQYLNRTQLPTGEECLADMLQSNDIQHIEQKQEFVKELAEKIDFRQHFAADAKLTKTDEETSQIIHWLAKYQTYVPKIMAWFPYVFGVLSLAVLVLYFLETINVKQLLLWFIIGLAISGFFIKKSNRLSLFVNKVQNVFEQYSKLLALVEETDFSSPKGKELQSAFREDEVLFSLTLKQFSKYIDAFEQRNNMLLGVFFNGLFLWDLMQAYKLENWIVKHHQKVEKAFNLIAEFDAWSSLGNFSYNHPNYTFPKIDEQAKVQLEVFSAIHPLLNEKIAVANDFSLSTENFVILTGANMAGKSTFLRTLALQIIMANVGLPVRGKNVAYKPIKLITSMRTADSLADESSYFYAELTRLKQIVDILNEEPHFVILDEILKGTNSKDKAIGAQKFVKRLLKEKAVGIIATHDLSLCTLADEFSSISNFYFDAEILNNELHFDYTLKTGVCKNMNASFLLEKMGLV